MVPRTPMPLDESAQDYRLRISEDLATLKETTSNILVQTLRTNGRVTKIEDIIALHELKLTLMLATDAEDNKRFGWWKDKLGTALISIAFSVVVATLLIILQKTNILSVSLL